jgi:hypothetical protein
MCMATWHSVTRTAFRGTSQIIRLRSRLLLVVAALAVVTGVALRATAAAGVRSSTTRDGAFVFENGGLGVTNADGSPTRCLVSNAQWPVWSPDGSRILFTRNLPSQDIVLKTLRVADGSTTTVWHDVANPIGSTYSWSPNSRRIVFAPLHGPEADSILSSRTRAVDIDTHLCSAHRAAHRVIRPGRRTAGRSRSSMMSQRRLAHPTLPARAGRHSSSFGLMDGAVEDSCRTSRTRRRFGHPPETQSHIRGESDPTPGTVRSGSPIATEHNLTQSGRRSTVSTSAPPCGHPTATSSRSRAWTHPPQTKKTFSSSDQTASIPSSSLAAPEIWPHLTFGLTFPTGSPGPRAARRSRPNSMAPEFRWSMSEAATSAPSSRAAVTRAGTRVAAQPRSITASPERSAEHLRRKARTADLARR